MFGTIFSLYYVYHTIIQTLIFSILVSLSAARDSTDEHI